MPSPAYSLPPERVEALFKGRTFTPKEKKYLRHVYDSASSPLRAFVDGLTQKYSDNYYGFMSNVNLEGSRPKMAKKLDKIFGKSKNVKRPKSLSNDMVARAYSLGQGHQKSQNPVSAFISDAAGSAISAAPAYRAAVLPKAAAGSLKNIARLMAVGGGHGAVYGVGQSDNFPYSDDASSLEGTASAAAWGGGGGAAGGAVLPVIGKSATWLRRTLAPGSGGAKSRESQAKFALKGPLLERGFFDNVDEANAALGAKRALIEQIDDKALAEAAGHSTLTPAAIKNAATPRVAELTDTAAYMRNAFAANKHVGKIAEEAEEAAEAIPAAYRAALGTVREKQLSKADSGPTSVNSNTIAKQLKTVNVAQEIYAARPAKLSDAVQNASDMFQANARASYQRLNATYVDDLPEEVASEFNSVVGSITNSEVRSGFQNVLELSRAPKRQALAEIEAKAARLEQQFQATTDPTEQFALNGEYQQLLARIPAEGLDRIDDMTMYDYDKIITSLGDFIRTAPISARVPVIRLKDEMTRIYAKHFPEEAGLRRLNQEMFKYPEEAAEVTKWKNLVQMNDDQLTEFTDTFIKRAPFSAEVNGKTINTEGFTKSVAQSALIKDLMSITDKADFSAITKQVHSIGGRKVLRSVFGEDDAKWLQDTFKVLDDTWKRKVIAQKGVAKEGNFLRNLGGTVSALGFYQRVIQLAIAKRREGTSAKDLITMIQDILEKGEIPDDLVEVASRDFFPTGRTSAQVGVAASAGNIAVEDPKHPEAQRILESFSEGSR